MVYLENEGWPGVAATVCVMTWRHSLELHRRGSGMFCCEFGLYPKGSNCEAIKGLAFISF